MKINTHLIIALLFTNIILSQTGQKNFIDQPYIETIGEVETEIIPNKIYLQITLNENDKKGKVSIEFQENELISILKQCNINIDKQLSVENFDGLYKRKFLGNNKLTKIKKYQLLIYRGEILAKIYHDLTKIDISNISIIKTDHSDMEALIAKNKLKALNKASKKASKYALAINQNIGKALYIKEIEKEPNYQYDSNSLKDIEVTAYGITRAPMDIMNLNIKPIIIKSKIMTRFILK